ncbi:MAG TPA: hypothetical protein VF088_07585 [Pyrinomonadaceae bacterium]
MNSRIRILNRNQTRETKEAATNDRATNLICAGTQERRVTLPLRNTT